MYQQQHNSKKESRRRRTKRYAAAHPPAEQMTPREPQWRDATNTEVMESLPEESHAHRQLTHLDEMQVPAFTYS